MNDKPTFEIRDLATPEDYAGCVRLQRVTWGEGFTELVPPVMLMLTQKVGGIAAGAFTEDGEMAGFVYGLTGYRDRKPVHWSHMLAVHPKFEGDGLGTGLKQHQRDKLLEFGIDSMRWTYDPLVAKNAHINFNRLGTTIVEYVRDMYGSDTGSLLHSGLGTDRFVVEWNLNEPETVANSVVGRFDREDDVLDTPIVNTDGVSSVARPVHCDLPDTPVVRIEIPDDIEKVKADSMDLGKEWRSTTRRACLWYMEKGYVFEGFLRQPHTNRCYYILGSPQGEQK